jgi:hypothetical protein
VETRTPGSAGRPGKPTGSNPGRAPRSDPTTLAMLALAFLTIAAATEHTRPPPADQVPLTRNEIAALFGTLITGPGKDARHRLRWSAWRRRHQHRARTCHYRRQAASGP